MTGHTWQRNNMPNALANKQSCGAVAVVTVVAQWAVSIQSADQTAPRARTDLERHATPANKPQNAKWPQWLPVVPDISQEEKPIVTRPEQ